MIQEHDGPNATESNHDVMVKPRENKSPRSKNYLTQKSRSHSCQKLSHQ